MFTPRTAEQTVCWKRSQPRLLLISIARATCSGQSLKRNWSLPALAEERKAFSLFFHWHFQYSGALSLEIWRSPCSLFVAAPFDQFSAFSRVHRRRRRWDRSPSLLPTGKKEGAVALWTWLCRSWGGGKPARGSAWLGSWVVGVHEACAQEVISLGGKNYVSLEKGKLCKLPLLQEAFCLPDR